MTGASQLEVEVSQFHLSSISPLYDLIKFIAKCSIFTILIIL